MACVLSYIESDATLKSIDSELNNIDDDFYDNDIDLINSYATEFLKRVTYYHDNQNLVTENIYNGLICLTAKFMKINTMTVQLDNDNIDPFIDKMTQLMNASEDKFFPNVVSYGHIYSLLQNYDFTSQWYTKMKEFIVTFYRQFDKIYNDIPLEAKIVYSMDRIFNHYTVDLLPYSMKTKMANISVDQYTDDIIIHLVLTNNFDELHNYLQNGNKLPSNDNIKELKNFFFSTLIQIYSTSTEKYNVAMMLLINVCYYSCRIELYSLNAVWKFNFNKNIALNDHFDNLLEKLFTIFDDLDKAGEDMGIIFTTIIHNYTMNEKFIEPLISGLITMIHPINDDHFESLIKWLSLGQKSKEKCMKYLTMFKNKGYDFNEQSMIRCMDKNIYVSAQFLNSIKFKVTVNLMAVYHSYPNYKNAYLDHEFFNLGSQDALYQYALKNKFSDTISFAEANKLVVDDKIINAYCQQCTNKNINLSSSDIKYIFESNYVPNLETLKILLFDQKRVGDLVKNREELFNRFYNSLNLN